MIRMPMTASAISRPLAMIASLLVAASLLGQSSRYLLGYDHVKGLVPLFNVDGERNLPTFFAVILLLLAAALLACIAMLERQRACAHFRSWALLSVGFLFLAYDEAFLVHEQLNRIRAFLPSRSGLLHFAWVVPAIVGVLVLSLVFLRFFLHLDGRTRRAFALAAALFLGGAIGLEVVSGVHGEWRGFANLTDALLATAEEALEMAGVIVFIHALIEYLREQYRELHLVFEPGTVPAAGEASEDARTSGGASFLP